MKRMMNYLREAGRNFINTFKALDRTIFLVVVYNLVFYLLLLAAYMKYISLIATTAEPLLKWGVGDFASVSKETAQSYMATIDMFYINMALYAVLFLVLVLAVYALTNLLVWGAITSTDLRKQKLNFFLRYSALNLVWCSAWALLFAVVVWSVKKEAIAYWLLAIALLYGHLTAALYISYFRKKRVGKSIRSAFDIGLANIHRFIVPYLLAAAVFIALNLVVFPFQNLYLTHLTTVNFIIFLFYFAWLRIYIYSFAKNLVK